MSWASPRDQCALCVRRRVDVGTDSSQPRHQLLKRLLAEP